MDLRTLVENLLVAKRWLHYLKENSTVADFLVGDVFMTTNIIA